jgi:hypothetical protein
MLFIGLESLVEGVALCCVVGSEAPNKPLENILRYRCQKLEDMGPDTVLYIHRANVLHMLVQSSLRLRC